MAVLHDDQAQFRLVPELDGTEAFRAVFRHHRFRPHFHETFLIGITEAGAEVFEARGARHVSPALSLRFLNPGEVHTGGPPSNGIWAYRCLYPSAALLEEIACELGGRSESERPVWFPELVCTDQESAQRLLLAFEELERPSGRLERSTRFRTALAAILIRHAGGRLVPAGLGREPRALAVAQTYLSDRVTEDFTLQELSRAAGLSPFHLVRAFKRRTGLTPFAFQAQLRVERARRLLAQGRSVVETATACGFYDRSHLARVFRAFVGVGPRAYRKAVARRWPDSEALKS